MRYLLILVFLVFCGCTTGNFSKTNDQKIVVVTLTTHVNGVDYTSKGTSAVTKDDLAAFGEALDIAYHSLYVLVPKNAIISNVAMACEFQPSKTDDGSNSTGPK